MAPDDFVAGDCAGDRPSCRAPSAHRTGPDKRPSWLHAERPVWTPPRLFCHEVSLAILCLRRSGPPAPTPAGKETDETPSHHRGIAGRDVRAVGACSSTTSTAPGSGAATTGSVSVDTRPADPHESMDHSAMESMDTPAASVAVTAPPAASSPVASSPVAAPSTSPAAPTAPAPVDRRSARHAAGDRPAQHLLRSGRQHAGPGRAAIEGLCVRAAHQVRRRLGDRSRRPSRWSTSSRSVSRCSTSCRRYDMTALYATDDIGNVDPPDRPDHRAGRATRSR